MTNNNTAVAIRTGLENLRNMPLDKDKQMTQDQRKLNIELIGQEMSNKMSLFHEAKRLERTKIMEKYRQEVGFGKLKVKLQKAYDKIAIAERDKGMVEKEIEALGLNNGGEMGSKYWRDENGKQHKAVGYEKLERLLEVVESSGNLNLLRTKLIFRMNNATTIGQAATIMNAVSGNDIIPSN